MDNDAELHAQYQAYLCSMDEHGCYCVALEFDQWRELIIAS